MEARFVKLSVIVLLALCSGHRAVGRENGAILGDFLRDADGTVRTEIYRLKALSECSTLGTRLPTAREIAEDAVKQGGFILEEADFKSGHLPPGYVELDFHRIWTLNPDGRIDTFYFSFKDYRSQGGDFAKYWVWSSSRVAGGSGAWVFVGGVGYFGLVDRDEKYPLCSARCLQATSGQNDL